MKWITAAIAAFFVSTAFAGTPCDEWANFSKIITYRFRDAGLPKELVKDELSRTMGKHPEVEVANGWIDYSYDNPDKDSIQIWKDVYKMCNSVKI